MSDDITFMRGTSFVSTVRKSLRQSSLMTRRQLSAPSISLLRKKDVGYNPFDQEQEETVPMGFGGKEEARKTDPVGKEEDENVTSADLEGNLTSPSGDGFLQIQGGVEDSSHRDEQNETGVGGTSPSKLILQSFIQRVQSTAQIVAAYARHKISVRKHSRSYDLNIPRASRSDEDSP